RRAHVRRLAAPAHREAQRRGRGGGGSRVGVPLPALVPGGSARGQDPDLYGACGRHRDSQVNGNSRSDQPRRGNMKTTPIAAQPVPDRKQALVSFFVLVAGLLFWLASGTAHAAPAAGTVIGNQATATYNDAGGTPRVATSNLVQTTV